MSPQRKICTLQQLLDLRARAAREGQTVVHCHGCFDIVHPGHVHHLQHARSLGDVLVDNTGRTLYGFTKDEAGTPTCADKCATAWPPLLVDNDTVPAGLDPKVFSVVARPDGKKQLKAGKWPLYRFSGDEKAGDVEGQSSGGVWFVVAPDGKLVKNAAGGSPTPAPAPTKPPAAGSGY